VGFTNGLKRDGAWQAEHGHSRRGEHVDVLSKVVLGGGLHRRGAMPQIDLVQVQKDDLFLVERVFEPTREDGLAQLALTLRSWSLSPRPR
jgi:hypothetical protein